MKEKQNIEFMLKIIDDTIDEIAKLTTQEKIINLLKIILQ